MRLRTFLLAILFLPTCLFAQTTSISPYSGFGLGELAPQGYDYSFAMGGVGFGFNDSLSINPMNPASYSFFKNHNPIFQLGYKTQFLRLSSDVNTEQINNGTINNIAIGFKITRKIGWAFGFNPATTVGYKIVTGELLSDSDGNTVPVIYEFEGDGGYTKLFTGFAYQIFNKQDTITGQTSTLSAGVNISYISGMKRSLYNVIYNSADFSFLNTSYTENQIIGDFGFDFGVQYQNYLKKVSPTDYINLSVGLSFNIPSNFKTTWESNYYTFTQDALGIDIPVDTIFYSNDLKGKTYVPLRLGIGMMLDFSNKFQVGIDFEKQNWDEFKQTISEMDVPNKTLTDSWRVAAGLQFTVVPIALRKMNTPYLQTITYRLGGRYSADYLKFGDYQLKNKALSLGFNFPLAKSQSYSSINIGMEFGTHGTTDNGLIKEDYINMMIGIILLPHRFNKWFVKRKYN
jgi:hypothetical protein